MPPIAARAVIPALPRYPLLHGVGIVCQQKDLITDRHTVRYHVSPDDLRLARCAGASVFLRNFRQLTYMIGIVPDIYMAFSVELALTYELLTVTAGDCDISAVRYPEKLIVPAVYETDFLSAGVEYIFHFALSFLFVIVKGVFSNMVCYNSLTRQQNKIIAADTENRL
jgi:hypothetical protein